MTLKRGKPDEGEVIFMDEAIIVLSWLNGVQTLAKRVSSSPSQIEYDLFVVR